MMRAAPALLTEEELKGQNEEGEKDNDAMQDPLFMMYMICFGQMRPKEDHVSRSVLEASCWSVGANAKASFLYC